MSIDVRVGASMIRVNEKGAVFLADCRIETSKKHHKRALSAAGKIKVFAQQSSAKVDERKRRSSDCMRKDDVKKQEKSQLSKYEKRFNYLEKLGHQYTSPRRGTNQNKSTFETYDANSRPSASTLLELARQVLHLEREVKTVLDSGFSRQRYDYQSNNTIDDSCETIDYLLKLDEVKRQLVDEFHLDLSNQDTTCDDSLHFENADDSTVDEFQSSFSEFSSFSDRNIERTMTTESDLSRLDEVTSNCPNDNFDKQTNSSNVALVLSHIRKILPPFTRNSLMQREKPPASLMYKQYKRMDIDFTIHELSAIYETDSDSSRGESTIASLK